MVLAAEYLVTRHASLQARSGIFKITMVGATPAPTFQMMILMQKNWTRPTAAMQLVHQQLQAHLFRSSMVQSSYKHAGVFTYGAC